jgi:anti-sigma factor (TIGR02949 family)
MHGGKYSCKDVVDLLSDYIDGECSPDDKAMVEDHLADCPGCIAFVNTFRKSISLAKNMSYEDIPNDLLDRLHNVLDQKTRLRKAERPTTPPPFLEPEKKMEGEDRI